VPTARCSYGASLDSTNIKEGDDVYFECYIEANPPVTRVSWRHNDVALVHNVSAGVIVSNQSLVLQQVVRAQAGRYSCLAHNPVGDGASNSLRLDVKYAPVCSPEQVTTYAVGRYEDAEVTCSVEANPLQESFQWTFNNTADTIDVPQGRFSSSSSHSVITYTPMTALDYGTLLCWAANEIGTQKTPCVFHIVPAGKPEAPSNCTVWGRTRTSVRVKCVAGGSGGLPQHFLLQATLKGTVRQQVLNFTASSNPDFYVEGLQVEGKYQLVIRAVNDKGSSGATHLTVSSIGTNGSIYQLHDGPLEAEVRDGGKTNAVNEGSPDGSDESYFDSPVLPTFIVGVLGVGSALVFLVIIFLLFITFRRRRIIRRARPLSESLQQTEVVAVKHIPQGDASKSPKCSHESPVLMTPEHEVTCLDRDIQQAESESDADPDVIPLQEASYRGYEVPPAATLLPSDRYKYAPVPAHLPNIPCPPQYSGVLGVAHGAPPLTCGQQGQGNIHDPYCPGPHHQHHPHYSQQHHTHHTYIHQPARSSTLPRRGHLNPTNDQCCYTSTMNPQQFPCPNMEGSLPPPPPEYLDCERKRVTFSRHASYEEDTPSTPLLKKGESSV
ncbi:Nephrin-like 3, partial [Homarus americanus]